MPYVFSVVSGSLPFGLTLDPATGAIAGTPTQTGVFGFEVQVTDGANPTNSTAINLAITITARKPGTRPVLYIGPTAINQPWIEVIADLADSTAAVVFHAMMLRPSTVAALGPLADLINPEYARQRR